MKTLRTALTSALLIGCAHQAPNSDTDTSPVAEADPFLWLEDVEGDEALDWVRSENQRTAERLEAHPHFKTFLTDASLYRWMVDMHKQGRVHALRCDLTGNKAMKSVAVAAKAMKMPIGALYLSNVEFYFNYDSGLGDNLRRLPTSSGSQVIRTYPFKQKKADYRYFAQKLTDFHAWLDQDVESFRSIFTQDAGTLRDGVWYLNGPK